MVTPIVFLKKSYEDVISRVKQASLSRAHFTGVTLVAVSKKQSVEAIEALYRLGHRDFGENYVQELLTKDAELKRRGITDIRWHFIGHLQTNKVKSLLPLVYTIHTVDSLKLASELSKVWQKLKRSDPLSIFIEVNLDAEETKSGLNTEHVQEFVSAVGKLPGLKVQGLMCIPSVNSNAREKFIQLRELEKKCQPLSQGMLSMGMSQDFEVALLEGATHVRVGTLLFGSR